MDFRIYPIQSQTCDFSQRCCRSFLAHLPEGFQLVDRRGDADLVLVFDSYDQRIIRELPLSVLLSPRTVMYSQGDAGVPVLPGLYVNLTRKRRISGLMGGHGYFEYLAETGGNPYCKGYRQSEGSHLFCFSGRNSHPVREQILKTFSDFPDAIIQDTSTAYDHWSSSRPDLMQSNYVENIRKALFSICPRGKGANCIRLFESMRLGIAPVLISDDLVLPDGPDWDGFLLRVPESRVAEIPSILEQSRARAGEMGELARQAYEAHFSPETMPQRILEQLSAIAAGRSNGLSVRVSRLGQHYSVKAYWALYFCLLNFRDRVRRT